MFTMSGHKKEAKSEKKPSVFMCVMQYRLFPAQLWNHQHHQQKHHFKIDVLQNLHCTAHLPQILGLSLVSGNLWVSTIRALNHVVQTQHYWYKLVTYVSLC